MEASVRHVIASTPALAGYTLRKKIGAGSSGAVWGIRNAEGRKRALKVQVVPPGSRQEEEQVEEEQAIAHRMGEIDVGPVVYVSGYLQTTGCERGDVGRGSERIYYIVMDRYRHTIYSAPVAILPGCVARLRKVVAAMHAAGISHSDIKSTDVAVASGGRVRLIDFGCAEAVGNGTYWDNCLEYSTPVLGARPGRETRAFCRALAGVPDSERYSKNGDMCSVTNDRIATKAMEYYIAERLK